MRVTARGDYALRAVVELAACEGTQLKLKQLATLQALPPKYLETLLAELRRAGIVRTYRGSVGGYGLAKPAEEITVADVVRVVDGPLTDVRGERPEAVTYTGHARALTTVWLALRANERAILERVSLRDIAMGDLPATVVALAESKGSGGLVDDGDRAG